MPHAKPVSSLAGLLLVVAAAASGAIISVRPQGTGALLRNSILRHDGRPPIAVDWWVTRDGDSYRLIDVNIEGVSQLVALREQFMAVITQHDGSVAALIEHLREKMQEVDRLSEKTGK